MHREINDSPQRPLIRTSLPAEHDCGDDRVARLSTNEMPYGPLPGVEDAVREAARRSHHYPDPYAGVLTDALAARHRIAPERLVTGSGSIALIQAILQAFVLPGEEVVYSWPSFEGYRLAAAAAGATCVPVARREHAHDLPSLLAAITHRTRVLLLCNPSNPTGTYLDPLTLSAFLRQVPGHVLTVLDQAYGEFVEDATGPDLAAAADAENVVVLRTFSKAWSLAGLRVGWGYATATIAAAIREATMPCCVNSCAQAAAITALRQEAEMRRRVLEVRARRDVLFEALRPVHRASPQPHANFIWLPLGDDSSGFADTCRQHGILVRDVPGHGVRVTVGSEEQNAAFLTCTGIALDDQSAGSSPPACLPT